MAKKQECDGALIWTLPDETLLAVLQNLTAKWDRQSWCMVCKKFQDLEAVSRKYVGLMRTDILEPVLRRYHHVERLGFTWCSEVKDVCLATVAKFTSQRLLSISLNGAVRFGAVGLRSLVECTSLQELDLSFCRQVRDEEVIALSKLQHLQTLKLDGCYHVTDVGLSAVSNCKELKTLGLSFCWGISDVGIQNVATGCLQLCNIDLLQTKVSDKGLAFFALLRNLECLSLEACWSVTDEGLKLLHSQCTTLQKLNLSRCEKLSGYGPYASVERSEQLQKLNPASSKLTTSTVGKGCCRLKELRLMQCEGVHDVGVVGFVTAHNDLKKLDLSGCFDITDVALKAVATNCRGLLSLKISKCRLITAEGLALIGRHCLSLEDLDLTGCKLNDDGLKSIARCTELRFLVINWCCYIRNAGLVHIGAACKNLLGFACYGSWAVGDEGVAAVASGCRRLKRVVLSSCEYVTDASLKSLASLKDLEALELRACKQVTSVGICHIATSCKHLRELDVDHCGLIGDPGILALSHGCQDLRKIKLSETAVTDVGMMAVASMPRLQDMELCCMMKVSTDCFASAVLTCGSLKYLMLSQRLRLALPSKVIKQLQERGTLVCFI